MNYITVSIIIVISGAFFLTSYFLTGNFKHYCSDVPGKEMTCQAGFSCVKRTDDSNETGRCVFATDYVSRWRIQNGATPLDNLDSLTTVINDIDSASCDLKPLIVEEQLEKINFCEVAEDCTAVQMVCPFECSYLINRNTLDRAELMRTTYSSSSCGSCQYRCPTMPDADEIDCIDNKCVISENKIKIFAK